MARGDKRVIHSSTDLAGAHTAQATAGQSMWQFGRAASSAFGSRAVGAAVMLGAQVEIARRAGVSGAGRIATALAVISVLAVIGRFGSDQLVLRRVATSDSRLRMMASYGEAATLCLPLLAAAAVGLFVLAGPIASRAFGDPAGASALRALAPAVPAFGLVAVQGEAIKGLGHAGLGSAVQSLIGPCVTAALLIGLPGAASTTSLAWMISAGYIASSICAHAVWRLAAGRRLDVPVSTLAVRDTRAFAREAWPFLGTSVFALILAYAPVLSLAILSNPADVGMYFAAERWTQISAMLLVAVNAVAGPQFAVLWKRGDLAGTRSLLKRTTVATAMASAVLAGVMLLGAGPLLRVFGPEFEVAAPALRILALAQFLVLATGPVTSLLVMSGGERTQRSAAALATVVVVGLCSVLVPGLGLVGAAAAGAVAVVVNKGVIVLALRETLHQRALHLGRPANGKA